MAGKKWFTEEQLCDLLMARMEVVGDLGDKILDVGTFCREFEIAHGLRADFLNYTTICDQHNYEIIEVKINADADSVAQIANYVWVLQSHLRNSKRNEYDLSKYDIRGFLLARTFDRNTFSLAAQANIELWRIKPPQKSTDFIEVIEEIHPFEEAAPDPRLSQILKLGDPLKFSLGKLKKPEAAAAPHV